MIHLLDIEKVYAYARAERFRLSRTVKIDCPAPVENIRDGA
jgi:hypothetical protein